MKRQTIKFKHFPELLKQIPKPPKEIYLIGDLPSDEDAIFLAVVGTRKFSNYGKEMCEKLIRELAIQSPKPIVIVSGIALGIDAIAHRAALENNLRTVAIPGSGLDETVFHPRTNIPLSREIIQQGGCLLSEFEWEVPAGLHTFPQRNRIIAGLSHGTLVIEAPEKSGALITSKFSLDFNREVFAVPGSVFNENSKGTNKLVKYGAVPVSCARDILEAFGIEEPKNGEEKNKNLQFEFSPTEQTILSAIIEPIDKDDLIRKLNLPTNEINSTLIMMQIKGIIKESDGEIYKNI